MMIRSLTSGALKGVVIMGLSLFLAVPAASGEHEPTAPGASSAVPKPEEPDSRSVPRAAEATALQVAPPAESFRKIKIESLRVEGARRGSVEHVVLSESRLVAGEEYTEQEIAQAARRVKRLPFVIDARPSLRRGSAPGQYTLVFTIEEHSPISFGATGDHWEAGRENTSTAKLSPNLEHFLGPLTQLRLSVDVGAKRARWFEWPNVTGANGGTQPDPTLESDDTPLAANVVLGLTRYDVVGPASRLDLAFSGGRELCRVKDFPTEPCDVDTGWGLTGSLLVPVARNSSLTLFAGYQVERATERVGLIIGEGGWPVRILDPEEEYEVSRRRVRFGGVWAYDTTDDPVAALKGTQITGGLTVWINSEDYKDYPYEERPFLEGLDFGIPLLRLQRLFPLSHGLTLSAVAAPLGGLGSQGEDVYLGGGSLGLRWVHAGRRNRYRLSLESGVIGAAEGASDSGHWTLYSALRFRSSHIVIALDGRWVR